MIPVAVLGTDVVAPPGKKFGTFTRPGVRFGKPLDFSRYEGMENDRYILRSITDEIMYEIMRLSGQEYVDKYAGKAKEESKKAPVRAGRPRRRGRAEEGVLTRVRFWTRPALAVEDRLFRALGILRVVLVVNAVALNLYRADNFDHPVAGRARAWPGWWPGPPSPSGRTPTPRGVRPSLLSADLAVALAAILVSPLVKGPDLNATIPGFWVIGALMAWAIQWRWQGGLVAAVLLCAADLAVRDEVTQSQLRQRLPAHHRRPGRRLPVASRSG